LQTALKARQGKARDIRRATKLAPKRFIFYFWSFPLLLLHVGILSENVGWVEEVF